VNRRLQNDRHLTRVDSIGRCEEITSQGITHRNDETSLFSQGHRAGQQGRRRPQPHSMRFHQGLRGRPADPESGKAPRAIGERDRFELVQGSIGGLEAVRYGRKQARGVPSGADNRLLEGRQSGSANSNRGLVGSGVQG
jgi:hypothetical protein